MGFSELHDPFFSSHFSRTVITDLSRNRREDSPTVQHPEVRPSPETVPIISRKTIFGGSLTNSMR